MESQIRQLDSDDVLSFARYGDWCSVADGASTGCVFERPDISTFYFIQVGGRGQAPSLVPQPSSCCVVPLVMSTPCSPHPLLMVFASTPSFGHHLLHLLVFTVASTPPCMQGLDVAADFASRLGYTPDAERYSSLSAATTERYNALWYHAQGSVYQDGYPISQILALQGGFAGDNDTAVFNTLVQVVCCCVHCVSVCCCLCVCVRFFFFLGGGEWGWRVGAGKEGAENGGDSFAS
jgi:hypothetical protein